MTTSQNSAAEFQLTPDEVKRLVNATPSFRNRVLIKTLYLTGVRREELCNLDVEDIDLERKRLRIRHGKGDKSRVVPFPETLGVDLRALIGRRSTGPLFVSQRQGRIVPRTVNYVVARAGKLAELTNPNPERVEINPHLLRHSFGRHFLANGGELRVLSQILGHANVAITHAVYGTASEDEVHSGYAAAMGGVQLLV